jgi:predicted nucleic acid-binding protein
MRLFLDANVIFSAAHSPNGRALALFRLAGTGRCTLVGSAHVVEEARRNLMVRSADRKEEFDVLVGQLELVAEAPPKIVAWAGGHGLPANDAPVLAAAVTSKADLLVTGDRTHFSHLFGREVGGVKVASLADALSSVLERVSE